MKAAYFDQFGGPDVLKYGDLPDPVPATDEIVVDVAAASVNAADWKFRSGRYTRHSDAKFPLIPGRDFSGTVSALGGKVGDLKIGDEVFGVLEAGKEGTYAEKLATKAAIVAEKPKILSHVDAAAVALTGLTAVNSLADTLRLKKGETILIGGGAGGVAGFAIQFAKHLGARVITTTSAANRDYVRDLGADEVIDYNSQDCDAVFDTVGGEVAQKSFAVLKSGGRAAFIASGMEAPKPTRADVVSLRPPVGRSRAAMERVAELVQSGAVRPPLIKLFRLSEAPDAHRLSESRHFRGKLVFKVR
jgi:NADPH:quinone reductase-like Zn-dependent oxidoreductase